MGSARRPPPLQLDANSFFETTVAVESPSRTSFFTRVYRLNWRMLIIAVAVLNAVRFSFSALQDFQDASIDRTHGFSRLSGLSIALGVMYTISCIIDVYGAISASIQRLSLLRIYTFLTCVSAMLVTVCGMSSTFRYFMLAEDILNECSVLALEGVGATVSTFRGSPWPLGAAKSADDAASKCINAWTMSSTSQITTDFLMFHILPAVFQVFIVCVYYTQVRNPQHAASLEMHPQPRRGGAAGGGRRNNGEGSVRLEAFPATSQSPLYASANTAGYGRSADHVSHSHHYATSPRPGAMHKILKKTMQAQNMTMKQGTQRASFAGAWIANTTTMSIQPQNLVSSNVRVPPVQGLVLSPIPNSAAAPGPPSFTGRQVTYGALNYNGYADEETLLGGDYDAAGFDWERR